MVMVTWEEEEVKGTGNHTAFRSLRYVSMHAPVREGRLTRSLWLMLVEMMGKGVETLPHLLHKF